MQRQTLIAAVIASIVTTALAGSAAAHSGIAGEPVVRGEVARLLRQAYDYEHRNANDNVYRNSRHHHPTRNVFRSSRHYQQKLAASSDGYPLRTFIRFGRSVDGGPRRQIEYTFAHPRRSPYGLPTIEDRGLEALVLGSAHDQVVPAQYELPRTPMRTRPLVVDDTPRIVRYRSSVEPTGSTSASKEGASIDDAWALLGAGEIDHAAIAFRRHVTDTQRGVEAMVGYGLSKLLAGDAADAASAFRRAITLDEQIMVRVLLDDAIRVRLAANDSAAWTDGDEADDAAVITAVLDALLE